LDEVQALTKWHDIIGFGLAKYAHKYQVFFFPKRAKKIEIWLALIGRSQWLTHVEELIYIYIMVSYQDLAKSS
jgi:hypothetical protein